MNSGITHKVRIEALDILPQRPPFVMIDALTSYEESRVDTTFVVREDNILVNGDGCLSEAGVMENIAQTCAARIGYISKYILHQDVKIGYIGQVKGLKFLRLPKVGETLSTYITVDTEMFGITQVHAYAMVGDETIASGIMKIAVRNDE